VKKNRWIPLKVLLIREISIAGDCDETEVEEHLNAIFAA